MAAPRNADPIDIDAMVRMTQQFLDDPSSIPAPSDPTTPAVEAPVDAPPPATLDDGTTVSVSQIDTAAATTSSAPVVPPVSDGGGSGVSPAPAPADDPALTPPDPADLLTPQPRVDVATGQVLDPTTPPEQPAPAEQPVVDPTTSPADPELEEPPALDIARLYELSMGRAPTADDVIQQIDVMTRLSALDEDRQRWVWGIMSGQIDPVAWQEEMERRASTPAAPAPTTPNTPNYWDDDTPPEDPRIAAQLAELERQQQQIAAEQARMAQARAQSAQQGADVAWREFEAEHSDWSKEELLALRQAANQSPIFGAVYAQTGDAHDAFRQTITSAALNHPHFRDRLMSSTPTTSELSRQNAAAALASNGQGSGGGGRAAGPTAPPRPASAPDPAAAVASQQPVASPLSPTPTGPAEGIDLHNRNAQLMEMARRIQAGDF